MAPDEQEADEQISEATVAGESINGTTTTIWVRLKAAGGQKVRINAADFAPALHQKCAPPKGAVKQRRSGNVDPEPELEDDDESDEAEDTAEDSDDEDSSDDGEEDGEDDADGAEADGDESDDEESVGRHRKARRKARRRK